MFAKMVLPRLGGAPTVWSVAMVFFQAALLAGYAYGVATYYYPFPFTSMSLYGAISSLLLALGLLAASPDYGIAAAIAAPGMASPSFS